MTDYYADKKLSFSTVRQFAQNPQRALDAWNGVMPWFTDDSALLYGSYVHARLQDALENRTDNAHLNALKDAEPALFKKDGNLYAKYEQADTVASVILASDLVQWVRSKYAEPDQFDILVEQGLSGEIEGIPFKGKPDVVVVDKLNKRVFVFDFKTSKLYPANGMDWISTFDNQRVYDSVALDSAKLFAWQAGVYIELLKQNGYADYEFQSRYIVATKQDVPRLDVWTISKDDWESGLDYVKTFTRMAQRYIDGELTAPVIADSSPWYNLRTHGSGNRLTMTSSQNTTHS